jgi:uncharacterized protein (DUF983 family)
MRTCASDTPARGDENPALERLTRAKCSTLVQVPVTSLNLRSGNWRTHRFAFAAGRRSKIARMVGSEKDLSSSMRPSRSKLIATALRRGLRKRCPHCGEGPLFSGWSHLERCSVCGLIFARNPGDTWAFTIIGDRLPIGAMIVLIYFGVMRSHRLPGLAMLVRWRCSWYGRPPTAGARVSRCITCRACAGLILRILSRRLLQPNLDRESDWLRACLLLDSARNDPVLGFFNVSRKRTDEGHRTRDTARRSAPRYAGA